MSRRRIVIAFFLTAAAGAGARALAAAPVTPVAAPAATVPAAPSAPAANAPAAAPAAAPIAVVPPTTSTAPILDQSTPKALLRSFFASHGEVDGATIRSLLYASNPIEQKVLDAVVQVELANRRLRDAEKEKFGKATRAPSVASSLEPASAADLDALMEHIEGDHASISAPRTPNVALEFVRVNGKWTLPISSLVGKLDAAIADSMGAATAAQIQIIDAVTAEVRAGKLTSEEQVRAELAKRLEARLAATRAATQPATHPAAVPTTAPTPKAH